VVVDVNGDGDVLVSVRRIASRSLSTWSR